MVVARIPPVFRFMHQSQVVVFFENCSFPPQFGHCIVIKVDSIFSSFFSNPTRVESANNRSDFESLAYCHVTQINMKSQEVNYLFYGSGKTYMTIFIN
jgi:hypothetical protein